MDATISTKLAHLADQLRHGAPPVEVAAVLDQLASHTLVALPHIDATRDDLTHWEQLSARRLRCEANADAWNLAGGVHETAIRDTSRHLWGAS